MNIETKASTAPDLSNTVLAESFVYECSITYAFKEPYTRTDKIVATKPSKARYKFYRQLGADEPYKDYFRYISVKKIGIAEKDNYYFSDTTIKRFNEVKEKRDIPFAELGMKIQVAGKTGIIVGANHGLNLDVDFGDGACNCHPKWKTTYFNNAGAILAQF